MDHIIKEVFITADLWILTGTAVSIGFLHTILGPDHYLPFNHSGKNDRELFSVTVPDITFFNRIKSKLIEGDRNFTRYRQVIKKWYGRTLNEKTGNMISDTLTYFTSGHKAYNSVSWSYKDKEYPHSFRNIDKNPQYSPDLKRFRENGSFWKRENYISEKYKRSKGDHGIGDNEYIGEELLKYIISVLNLKKDKDTVHLKKGNPVYKYDMTSLYVNSLVININLGSIMDKHIESIYRRRLDEIADAVCVGIYSICRGYDLKKASMDAGSLPLGRKINFIKYYKYNYIGNKRKSYD